MTDVPPTAPAPSPAELSAMQLPHEVGPFEKFGQRFVIRTTEPDLAAFLDDAFSAMRTGDATGAAVYRVVPPRDGRRGLITRDGQQVRAAPKTASAVLGRLIWGINRQVIEGARDRLVFHSGAVAVDGSAAVLLGPSETGKTTLVAALVERGCAYLTDEATVISPDLIADGYPKPLSIDRGSWSLLPRWEPRCEPGFRVYHRRQWQAPAHHLGEVAGPTPLGLLIFPRYERGAPPSLERVSPGAAVVLAARSTLHLGEDTLARWRVIRLADLASRVPAYTLVHDDLDRTCRLVVDTLRPQR